MSLSCKERTGFFKDCDYLIYLPVKSFRCYSRAFDLAVEFAPIAPIIDAYFGVDRIITGEFIGLSTKQEAQEKRIHMITNAALGTFMMFSGVATFATQSSLKTVKKSTTVLIQKRPLLPNQNPSASRVLKKSDDVFSAQSNEVIVSSKKDQFTNQISGEFSAVCAIST